MSEPQSKLDRATVSAYETCLRVADWCASHRTIMVFVVAPVFTLAVAAIGRFVLHQFPNSGDEYAYAYQAATLAEGRLSNPGLPLPDFFQFNYLIQADGKEYSSFPLGWPLLLALAIRLHVPVWLVNPILGTVSLFLIAALGARLHSARVGVLAAGITAVSGFFLFNAASYFSHTFCSVLLLAAACLAARDNRTRWWIPALIGFFLGWAVLARYFTAVVCAIPVIVLLCRGGGPVGRLLLWCAIGGLPWIAVLAAYNLALNGSPWQLTTLPSTVGLWFAPKFALRGADILSTQMLRFVLWTPPLLLFIYVYYLARAERAVRRGLIDWMPVLMAAALYPYIERGGNQYGPRFYYETFPFLAIFTTACLFREPALAEKPRRDRVAFGLMAASLIVMPLSVLVHAIIEQRVIAERMNPYRMVAAAGLAEAIVLIRGRVGTTRSMGPLDLTRNGIDHDGRVLYALDVGADVNCQLRTAFPERSLYLYVWDVEARRGRLEPIPCP